MRKLLGRTIKRITDLLFTLIALSVVWPFLLILWVLIRWRLGKPALFRQVRAGWQERPFTLYKFRSMTEARDGDGKLLPDSQRLTPLGCFLRRNSLDELPELFNILKGDMSLVGPRPLYLSYLPWYTPTERCRHEVKPGLTGWAQINGRNYLPWDERLALDVWYVANQSLWLDLKIIGKTVVKIITREGVSADTTEIEGNLEHIRREKQTRASSIKVS